MEFFDYQMNIAIELNRVVSIHCVNSTANLLNYFSGKETLPKKIMLHSYSCSHETAKSLMKLGKKKNIEFYFSFSYVINSRYKKLDKY